MSSVKDYYQILGISKNASQEDIKQAYKKLAKEHHPDMVDASNKESAEKRFKEINEAYQVLGDDQKRKMYDQFGTADPQAGFSGQRGQAGGQWGPFSYSYSSSSNGNPFDFNGIFDPFDIFEDIFGFRGYGGQKRPKKGKNLHYEMRLEFSEAVFGLEKEVSTEAGRVKIKIPAGIRDGTELRFAGKGMPGETGMPSGDLFLTLRVRFPGEFLAAGSNLVVNIEINFAEAALGVEKEIPVVDLSNKSRLGKAKLKIPAGTQYGSQFLLRGKGMPKLDRKGQDDIVVQVFVVVPRKVSNKQKELLEKYLQTN